MNNWGLSKKVATLWFGEKKLPIKGWSLIRIFPKGIFLYIIFFKKLMNEIL